MGFFSEIASEARRGMAGSKAKTSAQQTVVTPPRSLQLSRPLPPRRIRPHPRRRQLSLPLLRQPPVPAIPSNHGLLHAQQIDYIIRTAVRIIGHRRALVLYIYDRARVADGDPSPVWTMFQAGEDYITLARREDGSTYWRGPRSSGWERAAISRGNAPSTPSKTRSACAASSTLTTTEASPRWPAPRRLSSTNAARSASAGGKSGPSTVCAPSTRFPAD